MTRGRGGSGAEVSEFLSEDRDTNGQLLDTKYENLI